MTTETQSPERKLPVSTLHKLHGGIWEKRIDAWNGNQDVCAALGIVHGIFHNMPLSAPEPLEFLIEVIGCYDRIATSKNGDWWQQVIEKALQVFVLDFLKENDCQLPIWTQTLAKHPRLLRPVLNIIELWANRSFWGELSFQTRPPFAKIIRDFLKKVSVPIFGFYHEEDPCRKGLEAAVLAERQCIFRLFIHYDMIEAFVALKGCKDDLAALRAIMFEPNRGGKTNTTFDEAMADARGGSYQHCAALQYAMLNARMGARDRLAANKRE